uniref:Peptidase S1 domain-containing protein n=1 Tax=Anopheles albimanus TaxID=7167 RepID=A0A182FHM2_ANOAL
MGTTVWRVEADKTAEHSENSIESSTRNMVARRYAIIIVGIIFALVLFLLQTIQYTAAQHRKQSLDWRCEKGVVEYHRVPPATRIQFMSHLQLIDLNKENSTLNSLADWSSVSRSVMSELNANETLPACDILTEFNYHRCTNGSKNSQIVGGQMAEEGDAPFVVSLRNMEHERQHGFGTGLFCGGSLINAHLVLTAAHCLIVEPPNIGVVAGVLNRFDRSARMQFRTVLSYLVPAEWNQPTLFADIGLIALETPFELKGPGSIGSVQPIRLPTSTPQEGTRCMLYGWGKAPEDSGRLYFPIYLQKAEVAVLNLERCNQSISIMLHVPGGTLCAGRYEGLVDSCQGDSGGPLVCGDTPTVVGVVSFGWKCGLPGFPGIYTDVFQYREWLQLSIASDPHTWYKGTAMSRWNAPGITSILVIATLLRQGL